jgi:hypothetical protein
MAGNDAYKFGYEPIPKVYTAPEIAAAAGTFGAGNERTIPVETLMEGAVMFHYFWLPNRNLHETDADYANRIVARTMSRFGIPISWNTAVQRWEVCFETTVKKYNYYYPNPCAGFGVSEWGVGFNAGLICVASRDSRWAYLKSGSHVRNDNVVHRRYPIVADATRNYDYLRLKLCNEVREPPAIPFLDATSCNPGQAYDICITPDFQINSNIDGITAIAGEDDLMDLSIHGGVYQNNANVKSMYGAINRYFQKINTNGNLPVHRMLWMLNLLCLETDLKDANNLNVGFREFACSGFGTNQRPVNIPPVDLPHPFVVGDNYTVGENIISAAGVCYKRVFRLRNDVMLNFFSTYIYPNLLFRPIGFVTPGRAVQLPAVPVPAIGNVVDIQHAVDREQLRYNMNEQIGNILTNNMAALRFDSLHNIFYLNNGNLQNRVLNVHMTANVASQNPLAAPFNAANPAHIIPINVIAGMLSINVIKLENYKIVKELFTNKAWQTQWMASFRMHLRDGTHIYFTSGPFYNPLSIPITNFDSMINVYAYILRLLEAAPAGNPIQHSNTWDILNGADAVSVNYRVFLQHLLTNPINHTYDIGGVQHPYICGWYLLDARPVAARIIQAGGGKNRRVNKNNNIFTSNTFRNTFKHNWNKYYNKTRKMADNIKTEENKETKETGAETSTQTGGHASENITELTKDQEYILDYIQKDEMLGKLWNFMFSDAEKIKPIPSTISEQNIFKNITQTDKIDFSKFNTINIKKYSKNTKSNNNRPMSSSKTRRHKR